MLQKPLRNRASDRVVTISAAGIFAEAIERIYSDLSVNNLFAPANYKQNFSK
jgi:phosphoribosylpyrophosphate synthetase